jgi:hypothetical protein
MVKSLLVGEKVKITKGVHKGKQGTVRRCEGAGYTRKWIILFSGGIEAPIASRSLEKIDAVNLGAHALAASAAHAVAAESDDQDAGEDEEGSAEEAENTDDEAAEGSPVASDADVARCGDHQIQIICAFYSWPPMHSLSSSAGALPPTDPAVATIVAGRAWKNLGDVTVDAATKRHKAAFRARDQLHARTTHLDLFLHVLPAPLLREVVEATNASQALQNKIDERELLVFFGLLAGMSSMQLPARSDYFAPADPAALSPSPNFARFMSLRRFEEILRHLRLTSYTAEHEKASCLLL